MKRKLAIRNNRYQNKIDQVVKSIDLTHVLQQRKNPLSFGVSIIIVS